VRWLNENEWAAAKLVGLYGSLISALVALYLIGLFG
jgi:hypothetical protein